MPGSAQEMTGHGIVLWTCYGSTGMAVFSQRLEKMIFSNLHDAMILRCFCKPSL